MGEPLVVPDWGWIDSSLSEREVVACVAARALMGECFVCGRPVGTCRDGLNDAIPTAVIKLYLRERERARGCRG